MEKLDLESLKFLAKLLRTKMYLKEASVNESFAIARATLVLEDFVKKQESPPKLEVVPAPVAQIDDKKKKK